MQSPHRLRTRTDFERARRRGRSWSTALVALNAVRNDLPLTRCGFVTSKRVGGAVVRNKVRRRLREIVRRRLTLLPPGWDLVLSARTAAAAATFADLEQAVDDLCQRAGLIGERAP